MCCLKAVSGDREGVINSGANVAGDAMKIAKVPGSEYGRSSLCLRENCVRLHTHRIVWCRNTVKASGEVLNAVDKVTACNSPLRLSFA